MRFQGAIIHGPGGPADRGRLVGPELSVSREMRPDDPV